MGIGAALAATAVAGVAGSVISSSGQQSAADTQAQAANNATAVQQQNLDQVRSDLGPFRDAGLAALPGLANFGGLDQSQLAKYMTPFSTPAPVWNPTQAGLEQTPGYQFTLNQGLKTVQNAAAARGGGVSGNALRAAADYSTGLADNTYNQQFQNFQGQFGDWAQQFGLNLNQNSQLFNMLLGANSQQFGQLLSRAQLGGNAAAQSGNLGVAASGQIGNSLIQGGNAAAAGQVGSANAIGGGLANAGNSLAQYSIYNRLFPTAPSGSEVGPSLLPNSINSPGALPASFLGI